MEKPNQDNWYTYASTDKEQGFLGQLALEKQYLENHEVQYHAVLESLVTALLAKSPTYDYYFGECYDTPAPPDLPHTGLYVDNGSLKDFWHTLYRTSHLYGKKGNLWPYTYDHIRAGYTSPEGTKCRTRLATTHNDHLYLAISRNGCSAASALTEYIRLALPQKG
jgi:hypothetical protein